MSVLNAKHFHDEEAAFAKLESVLWPHGPVCPHCGNNERIYALQGVRSKPSKTNPEGVVRHGLKKCGKCRKQFTVRVGTVFESSHIPLHKWFQGAHLLCSSKKGISSHQLHRTLDITYEAAWFMSHRIREAMRAGPLAPMGGSGGSGIIEADETYFGKTEEQQLTRTSGRPFKTRAGKGPANKRAVIALVERGGSVRTFHVERADKKTVTDIVHGNIDREARLMTDESKLYGKELDVKSHERVRHRAKEYVRGDVTTNSVEGYFSIFKRGMKGVYQHCSEKHLHRYLAEFDFRYNHRSAVGVEDTQRAVAALEGAKGKRLTYRTANEGGES
jgi:transposase-like protein